MVHILIIPFSIQHPLIDAKVTENGRFQLVAANVKLATLYIKMENNVSVSVGNCFFFHVCFMFDKAEIKSLMLR